MDVRVDHDPRIADDTCINQEEEDDDDEEEEEEEEGEEAKNR